MVLHHEAGRRRLSDEELDRASRQVQNFERKLESMKKRTDAVSERVMKRKISDSGSHARMFFISKDHKERADEFRSLQRMNQMNYMDIGGEMRKLQGAGDLIVDVSAVMKSQAGGCSLIRTLTTTHPGYPPFLTK